MKNILKNLWSVLSPLLTLILVIIFLFEVSTKQKTEINYFEWICIFLVFIVTKLENFKTKEDK